MGTYFHLQDNCETTSEPVENEVDTDCTVTVVCPDCKLLNTSTSECQRCHCLFGNTEAIHFPIPEPIPESALMEILQMSKEPCSFIDRCSKQVPSSQTTKGLPITVKIGKQSLKTDDIEKDHLQENKKLKLDIAEEGKDPQSDVEKGEKINSIQMCI